MEKYILVVEDDYKSQQLLQQFLTSNGYKVDCANDGLEGIQMYKDRNYNLILLDIVMPNLDGFSMCKMIRKESDVPIIFVTALSSESDQIKGFDLLCDDYIVKPFAFEELTARIRSLGRRSGKWEDDNLLTICDISYDCNARLLSGPTGSIRLSGREGRLLEVLLRSFELVIRREVLLVRVWGVDAEVEDCNLDTYIHYLRKRLSYVGSTLALKTIRGVGYMLASS